jgi:hypothetical protein
LGGYAFPLGALPLLLIAAIRGVRKNVRLADAFVYVGFTVLLFSAARNIPLFAIAVAPLIVRPDKEEAQSPQRVLSLPILVCAVFVGGLANAERFASALPTTEIIALQNAPGEHRAFCEKLSWCGYLSGNPRVSVFMDGRADPYPLGVWNEYETITHVRSGWDALLDSYKVDAIVSKRDSSLDQALGFAGPWHEAVSDPQFRLWTRTL